MQSLGDLTIQLSLSPKEQAVLKVAIPKLHATAPLMEKVRVRSSKLLMNAYDSYSILVGIALDKECTEFLFRGLKIKMEKSLAAAMDTATPHVKKNLETARAQIAALTVEEILRASKNESKAKAKRKQKIHLDSVR